MKTVRSKLDVGRPRLPLGSSVVVVKLSPKHREMAKKLGGEKRKITQGIRNALEASMTELQRKNEVAALLFRAAQLNAQLKILHAELYDISENIISIQSGYEKETTS